MTLAEEAIFPHILRTSGSVNIKYMVTIQNHAKKLPVNACIQQEAFYVIGNFVPTTSEDKYYRTP